MSNLFKKSKSAQGFTLLETLVAIGIITIGVVSAINLVSFGISRARLNSQELIVIDLAQEGIEIIRNKRDTNWLVYPDQDNKWSQDIDGNPSALGGKRYRVEIGEIDKVTGDPNISTNNNYVLKMDANGFYNFTSGTNTNFRRQIIIYQEAGEEQSKMRVYSIVKVDGTNISVTIQEDLYNWW